MVKVAASKSKTMIRYKMRFDTVVIDRYRDSAIALDVACRSCAAPVSKKGSSSCTFFDEVWRNAWSRAEHEDDSMHCRFRKVR